MNRYDALDRELRSWFIETPVPRTPGFRDDVLQRTAQLRQRRRWSFPERWLPMSVVTLGRRTFPPFPWRAIGLLALLALLLVAVAAYVGSQQRLPAPFGLAGSGLLAYSQNGDIFAVDPTTGLRRSITSGPEVDAEPRWSLDGTRLAFLRGTDTQRLVIVDAKSGEVITTTGGFATIDSDTIAWSPDGRQITMAAGALDLIDAQTGSMMPLAVPYLFLDVYWRPLEGRQLLFLGGSSEVAADVTLFVVDVDDPGSLQEVARVPRPGGLLRPSGWADDGRKVVYTIGHPDIDRVRTHVKDLATGNDVVIEAAFAHVSNDGRRLLAIDDIGRPCVASIDGGSCRPIGTPNQAYGGMHAAGAFWSPDDAWVIVRHPALERSILLDPDGPAADQPSWIDDGAVTWQRVAR